MGKSFGTVCCALGCKNNTANNKGRFSFHAFPRDAALREEWVRRINRPGGKTGTWWPAVHDKLCGAHFNESGRKKYEDKVPHIFPPSTEPKFTRRRSRTRNAPGQPATARNGPLKLSKQLFVAKLVILNNGVIKTVGNLRPTIQLRPGPSVSLVTDGALDTGARGSPFDRTCAMTKWGESAGSIQDTKGTLNEMDVLKDWSMDIKEEPLEFPEDETVPGEIKEEPLTFPENEAGPAESGVTIKREPPDWTSTEGYSRDWMASDTPIPLETVFIKTEPLDPDQPPDLEYQDPFLNVGEFLEMETRDSNAAVPQTPSAAFNPEVSIKIEPNLPQNVVDWDPFLNVGEFLEVETNISNKVLAQTTSAASNPEVSIKIEPNLQQNVGDWDPFLNVGEFLEVETNVSNKALAQTTSAGLCESLKFESEFESKSRFRFDSDS